MRQLFAAALLVFFAAATGARIVAADFRAGANGLGFGLAFRRLRGFTDHVAGIFVRRRAGGGTAKSIGILVQGLLGDVAQEIFKRHHARRAAENIVADLRFYVDHQFVENLERLGFVFQQRIALAVRAQAAALAQAEIG